MRSNFKMLPSGEQSWPTASRASTRHHLYWQQDSREVSRAAVHWDEEVTRWWGEWSSWSTCSRTCGGGVMSRERHCLRQRLFVAQGTDNSVCVGQAKRYQLCHKQLCPSDTISFKQQQCLSFNGKAFGRRYYHWMPFYSDDYTSISNKPCDLQCTTTNGERQLIVPAQDGTFCKDRTYQGVCINGKCEPVGCDGRLYSSKTMDRCRVCGGDGSACYRVSGSFRKEMSHLGYALITNIPAGAMDILITERRKTENILALSDTAGHFFINGNSAVDNPQNFRVAGTVIKYRRPSNLHADGLEYIIAQGPINQSLNVMYYNFNGKLPHITYDYTVPKTPALHTQLEAITGDSHPYSHYPESHHENPDPRAPDSGRTHGYNNTWASQDNEDNSFTQGDVDFQNRGFVWENSTVKAGDWIWGAEDTFDAFSISSDYHETGEAEQEERQKTGGDGKALAPELQQIPLSTVESYNVMRPKLSRSQGMGVSRLRFLRKLCHRGQSSAALCKTLQLLVAKLAQHNTSFGGWRDLVEDWTKPGELQTTGKENFLGGMKTEIQGGNKAEEKNEEEEIEENINYSLVASVAYSSSYANLTSHVEPLQAPDTESNEFDASPLGRDISLADMYRWKVSAYAPCSSTCTSGISSSYAMCVRYDGAEVEETYCDALTRPEPTHEFCTGRECLPRWESSRWSECSRTCGEGYQYRTVRCWKMLAPGFDSSVYDELCEGAKLARPMARKVCTKKACGPQWELSEWSECSARCGARGVMRREVRCSVDSSFLCDVSKKPLEEKECTGPPCDRRWTASEWGPCSGPCGEGRMSRHIVCRNMEGQVISDTQCDPNTKPLAIYPCGDKNCPAHWVEQEWDQCNASCGRGEKSRKVLCVGLENGGYREYPEARCDLSHKPEEHAACFRKPCSAWFTTSWSQCSKTCGIGQQVRDVKCYQGEQLGQGCDLASKPDVRQMCQVQSCPTDAPDESCEDKVTANCALVLKVKLCSHWYYRKVCCKACRVPSP
ncbi:ADAMTS-like protein 2 isoform X2 [Microcaecilia unicolor]|uniref:ADAMTS-like protein 2 isoform X2 n=1 Tax=Microcaecilia unicolor TaxID=1415580 RepID=A0A6P7YG76_9AMPH|nr:ADAMTS-like protein 2 isoform X2 [Microcaecilia unicolor]